MHLSTGSLNRPPILTLCLLQTRYACKLLGHLLNVTFSLCQFQGQRLHARPETCVFVPCDVKGYLEIAMVISKLFRLNRLKVRVLIRFRCHRPSMINLLLLLILLSLLRLLRLP